MKQSKTTERVRMKRKAPENPTEKKHDDDNVNNGDGGEGDYSSGSDDKNGVTVLIDSEVLDCPICFEPFQLPIFQCRNGHLICSRCCSRLHNKCPVCTFSISRIRCLALESIVETNRVSCPYVRFGCEKSMVYNLRNSHKESCLYAPCFCPIPSCRFIGSSKWLSSHLWTKHLSFEQQEFFAYGLPFEVSLSRKQLFYILHESDGLVFLLLSNQGFHSGYALSMICIRAGSFASDFQYELGVAGDMGKKLRLDGSPENARKWREDYLPKFFLYVPNDLSGSSGVINVDVCIRKIC